MTNSKLPAIIQSNALQKTEQKLAIINKLLAEIDNQWIIDFFQRNPQLFIRFISGYYHFSYADLEKYKDVLIWSETWYYVFYNLSRNQSLSWSESLIEKYKDKWNWEDLSQNQGLPWSEELIEKFKDKWSWYELSINVSIPWTINLIKKYEDNWYWDKLSSNQALPWSIELIERFKGKWSWWYLSENHCLPWSEELIENFEKNWNWEHLSLNSKLPWSEKFIDRFKDRWHFTVMGYNDSIPWTKQISDKYSDRWLLNSNCYTLKNELNSILSNFDNSDYTRPWSEVTVVNFPWNQILLQRYKNLIPEVWLNISNSKKISWSIEILTEFKHKLNWERLSMNKSFPWSWELIEEFRNILYSMPINFILTESLPWSKELLLKFEKIDIVDKSICLGSSKYLGSILNDSIIEKVMLKMEEKNK